MAAHTERGEADLLGALRRGDERAFTTLLERHNRSLFRLARVYVRDAAVAEEVVQDTWLAVLEGINGFEGRSTLSTWIHRILVNRAKTRGQRERRQVPLSALGDDDAFEVPDDRFLPSDDPQRPHQWAAPPCSWPQERVLARETVELVRRSIAQLPPAQQVVLGLRDIDGWSAEEVCDALAITQVNQRVLLHRARTRVRADLETYLGAS